MPKVIKTKIKKSKYEYLLVTTPRDCGHPDILKWGVYDIRQKQCDFLVTMED
jgi:hypothetical protein